jgi:hypothetical protein
LLPIPARWRPWAPRVASRHARFSDEELCADAWDVYFPAPLSLSLVANAFAHNGMQREFGQLLDLHACCASTAQRFAEHPDAAIIASMPGLAELSGARILAEIGDDRARFADARGLKAYAGCAPVTRASGKTTAVLHRRVKNQRQAPPRHAPL